MYALASGTFMRRIALALEHRFPGVAVQSVVVNPSIFHVMCTAYATGLVRVTRPLFIFASTATARIALVYLAGVLLVLAGTDLPFLHEAGTGVSLWFGFILDLASLTLPVDCQRLPRMVDRTAALYSYGSAWA